MIHYNLEKEQRELEEESRLNGGKRTRDRDFKHAEKHSESLTKHGKRITAATIDVIAKALVDRVNITHSGPVPLSSQLLSQIDPYIAAIITTRFIIDAISQTNRKFTAAAISLGGKIEDEIRFTYCHKDNPYLVDKVIKDIESRSVHYGYKKLKLSQVQQKIGTVWNLWDTKSKLHVGEKLIDVFITNTGLVKIEKKAHRGKTYNYLLATDKTMEWINHSKKFNEFLDPELFPMVVKPTTWETPFKGGYRTLKNLYFVKGHKITSHLNYLQELTKYEMPVVYEGVNAMQDTKWSVNSPILLVLKTCFNEGDRSRGKLINNNLLDLPQKPHDISTNKKALKDWKAKAVVVHTSNERTKSKKLATAKTIYLANKFDNREIYFPHTTDFRNRAYAVVPYLNPQGTDYAKALLRFSKGIPLGDTGSRSLAIHIANVFGQDKLPLDEREKWTIDNTDTIIKCSSEPFSERFWETADKPWAFLAGCMEWHEYTKRGKDFKSTLPVASDGSCNGLQHFSAMLRDEVGGHAVNLTPSNQPQDIYGEVLQVVVKKLENAKKSVAEVSENERFLATEWLDMGLDRGACKRSVMTLPYGSTRYSATEFVDEYIQKRIDAGEELNFQNRQASSIYLAGKIWDSIGEVVVKAPEAMAWLQKVARLLSDQKTPVFWITPLGFPVRQAYYSQAETVLRTKMMGRIRIRSTTTRIDKRRQANGISPNFVHALDATMLYMTIHYCKQHGINDFAMVHDSFGTHAANQQQMNVCLREAFRDLYSQVDPLDNFLESVLPMIPEKLHRKIPELPEKGNLDINDVMKADYFFS